jgi:fibronectin-binding autotransporter adhesin
MELRVRYSLGLLLLGLLLISSASYGAIVQTGNVTPSVGSWGSNTAGTVGNTSDGSIFVDGGSVLSAHAGLLGNGTSSTGTATVSGSGSKWTNSDFLYVGTSGHGVLNIEAGGEVSNTRSLVGLFADSVGTITVTGIGSKWVNSDYLSVGSAGSGNLSIETGGLVNSQRGFVGANVGSIGTATISGAGSKWTNSSELQVGGSGQGTLTIEDGASLSSGSVLLGIRSGSTGSVTVTGLNSLLTTSNTFQVGNLGSGTLTVSDGAEIVVGELLAPQASLFGNGTITATNGAVLDADLVFNAANGNQISTSFGTGGILTVTANGGTLGAGYGQSGTLMIAEGVNISSREGYLGYQSGSTGNATVTGVGSKWTVTGALYVGRNGSGTLTVDDGGEVVAATLYASLSDLLGNGTITATKGAVLDANLVFDAAHGNQISFAFGSGGTLALQVAGGNLGAGYKQNGSLTVSEGVNITSSSGYFGDKLGSTGVGTVTGTGSRWTNTGTLYVGYSGSGTLTIELGGQVNAQNGYIGLFSNSTSTAVITGVGSKWINSNSLTVGNSGNGTLQIFGGGYVSNPTGLVADDANSVSSVAVSGTGSIWKNSGALTVGNLGTANLNITSAGLVTVASSLTIDQDLDNDSFINMATGGKLAVWGNVDDTLTQFLGVVQGTDAIRYWNHASLQWSPLSAATFGTDYTLSYITTGDLTGYTLLTVGSLGTVGDYDGDGDIDGRDFLILQRNPGLGSVSDWQNAYGNSELAASTSVPEPSALVLAISLAAASSFSRRRNFAR